METILAHAQKLVYTLLDLMPTKDQRESLEAMLEQFLEATGHPSPEHSPLKSGSALSRFLNEYCWSTRKVIRTVREQLLEELLKYAPRGRRPWLQVIIDLTTLEKTGKFKQFKDLIQWYNGKRGLHIVVVYLVVGGFRVPWGFRVWRGKGTLSPAQLAIRLVNTLPQKLVKAFRFTILADTAFGSVAFLRAMYQRRYPVIVGVRRDRQLNDGRQVCELVKPGQQVRFNGLPFLVTVSWFYTKRKDKWEKRFVLSTRPLKASTVTWWGRRRWAIEGFFKTIKYRFGLDRFGQQTLRGVYRWLILSMISFILAHWIYLATEPAHLPDWGKVAAIALQVLFPQAVVNVLLARIEQVRPLLQSLGFELRLVALEG